MYDPITIFSIVLGLFFVGIFLGFLIQKFSNLSFHNHSCPYWKEQYFQNQDLSPLLSYFCLPQVINCKFYGTMLRFLASLRIGSQSVRVFITNNSPNAQLIINISNEHLRFWQEFFVYMI